MHQHELESKQEEKKRMPFRRSSTGSPSADLELCPRPGLPPAGQLLLSLQRIRGNQCVQRVVDATRLGHSLVAASVYISAPSIVQRQEAPDEEEEKLQMQRVPNPTQVGPEGSLVPPDVEAAIERARSGGQPLEDGIQAEMGKALGQDFSMVRVHTDAEADILNRQLSARAFTTGLDIFFRQGEYSPSSSSSQELLAHEVAHVVQQSTGRVSGGGGCMIVRHAGDAFEQEAEALGKRAERNYTNPHQQKAIANAAMAAQANSLALQRTVGNGVVQRIWKCSTDNTKSTPDNKYHCKLHPAETRPKEQLDGNLYVAQDSSEDFKNALKFAITRMKKSQVGIDTLNAVSSGQYTLIIEKAGERISGLQVQPPQTLYAVDDPGVSLIYLPGADAARAEALFRQAGQGSKVTKAFGALKPSDFGEGVEQPLHFVAQHEFVHAWLQNKRIDKKIQANEAVLLKGSQYKGWGQVEEGLVTGICYRCRLSISENAYRLSRTPPAPLRTKYVSVGLEIDDAHQGTTLTGSLDKQLETVLREEIGIPPEFLPALVRGT